MTDSEQREELILQLVKPHRGHGEKKLWNLGFPAARFHNRARDFSEGFTAEKHRMILLGKVWNSWGGQFCFLVEASDSGSSPIAVKLTAYRDRAGEYKLSGVDIPSLRIGTTLDLTLGTTRSNFLKSTDVTVVSCPEDEDGIERILRRELSRL